MFRKVRHSPQSPYDPHSSIKMHKKGECINIICHISWLCQLSTSEQVQVAKKFSWHIISDIERLSLHHRKGGEDNECYELRILDLRLTTSSRPSSLTTYKLYLTSSHVCSWMSYTGLSCPCSIIPSFNYVELGPAAWYCATACWM